MSLNNDLIYPVNKITSYTKKSFLTKNKSKIINLILPGYKKGSSIFKLNEKIIPKLFLSKRGFSLKNLNIKNSASLLKDNVCSNSFAKDKLIKQSNSENKMNIINKKNNIFYIPNDSRNIHIDSLKKIDSKKEIFPINLKSDKICSSSRNKSYNRNIEEILYSNKNTNNSCIKSKSNHVIYKQNKKIKKNKSFLVKNKKTHIPKFQTKINLTLCEEQQKKLNYKTNSYKPSESRILEKNKTYRNIPINFNDKENLNINLINLNESNINENLLLSKLKRHSHKRIKLPFSPINKEKFFRKLKLQKFYIRNSKNEANIPHNKNKKLSRQNSFYNYFNLKNTQNRIYYNNTRDERIAFPESDIYKKNNSISSIDMAIKSNISYSFANSDLCIVSKENNFEYKVNDRNSGVEMNHFRIVKIIQDNKNNAN